MSDRDEEIEQEQVQVPYPLAWSQHGDPIELPPEAGGWRVRRHKIGDRGGAPELVYSDAKPLILDLSATAEELMDRAGGKPGRYRLDAIDAYGRPVKAAPAYALIERGQGAPVAAAPEGEGMNRLLAVVEQLVKTTTEGMAQIAGQFSSSMNAASGLMLPAHKRRPIEVVVPQPTAVEVISPQGFDWNAFWMTCGPMVQAAMGMFMQKMTPPPSAPPAVGAGQ